MTCCCPLVTGEATVYVNLVNFYTSSRLERMNYKQILSLKHKINELLWLQIIEKCNRLLCREKVLPQKTHLNLVMFEWLALGS